jgi:hypothetical protein
MLNLSQVFSLILSTIKAEAIGSQGRSNKAFGVFGGQWGAKVSPELFKVFIYSFKSSS